MSPSTPNLPAEAVATLVVRLRTAGCVFAEDEAELLFGAARSPEHLESMAADRVSGLPLEHVLGWAAFRGLRVEVDPRVFVPRRRTELLVEEAVVIARAIAAERRDATGGGDAEGRSGAADDATGTSEGAGRTIIVDLCCGTGAVGAALLAELQDIDVRVYAADIDPAAVASARRNLEPRGGIVVSGDLFDPLPDALKGAVDVLVANAPYVPTDAIALMPPEAREHEASVALDGGFDGLDLQRRVADGAASWLRPGGWLIVETSEDQSPRTAQLFVDAGLTARIVRSEEVAGTAVVGQCGTATTRE